MAKQLKNKWCFVPNCTNTTLKTPNKTFISVPKNLKMKQLWFKAVKRDFPTSASTFYCCEDHFNVQEDIENYLRYQMVGGYIRMKPGVVPHIFACQRDGRTFGRKSSNYTKPKKKNGGEIIQIAIEEKNVPELPIPEPPSEMSVNIPGQLLETVLRELPEGDHNPYEVINVAPSPQDSTTDSVSTAPKKKAKKKPRKKMQDYKEESSVSDCLTSRESVTNNDEKSTEAVVYIWKNGQYISMH